MTLKATQLVSYLYNKPNMTITKLASALPDRRLTQPFEIVTTTELVYEAIPTIFAETVLMNQG